VKEEYFEQTEKNLLFNTDELKDLHDLLGFMIKMIRIYINIEACK